MKRIFIESCELVINDDMELITITTIDDPNPVFMVSLTPKETPSPECRPHVDLGLRELLSEVLKDSVLLDFLEFLSTKQSPERTSQTCPKTDTQEQDMVDTTTIGPLSFAKRPVYRAESKQTPAAK